MYFFTLWFSACCPYTAGCRVTKLQCSVYLKPWTWNLECKGPHSSYKLTWLVRNKFFMPRNYCVKSIKGIGRRSSSTLLWSVMTVTWGRLGICVQSIECSQCAFIKPGICLFDTKYTVSCWKNCTHKRDGKLFRKSSIHVYADDTLLYFPIVPHRFLLQRACVWLKTGSND